MLSARPWNSSLPVLMKPTSASSAPREGIRERALGGGRRIVALGHVVLQEPGRAVGPRLARAERAVVRVFHRTGVGRLIDRARLEQLVQLRDLGRVLLGRRPGPVDDRAALVHEPLARLERLLLVVQRAGELLDLAPLLRRRLGREPAQSPGRRTARARSAPAPARSASSPATIFSLAARTFSAASTSLARSCESCASRTAADCAISWSTCSALLPSLARSASISASRRSCSAMIRSLPSCVMLNSVPSSSRAIRSRFFARSLHARGVVRSGRRSWSRRAGVRRPFQERDPGLGLIAGARQLVELGLQRVDLRACR